MIEVSGSLFGTNAKAIGHGVNCAGVMGAGIAKPIKDMFPRNFENYRAACQSGHMTPGKTMVCEENGTFVFNMATQLNPGRDARYDWLFTSALRAAEIAVNMDIDTIAIPRVGCGIGGLEWDKVAQTLVTVEIIVDTKMEWEVWTL